VWQCDADKLELFSKAYTVFKKLDFRGAAVTREELLGQDGFPKQKDWTKGIRSEFFSKYPHFHDLILDQFPEAPVLVLIAQLRLNCNVDSQHINVVQREILAYAREKQERFYYHRLSMICEGYRGRQFDGKDYDDILRSIARNYPNIGRSIMQSGLAIAGEVNRLLYLRLLESVGLKPGTDFNSLGSQEEGDIRVYGPTRDSYLTVEAKSMKARERLGKSISSMHGDVVAVGFFDTAKEFTQGKTSTYAKHRCLAIYMPPDTLKNLPKESASAMNYQQRPLYRSNEVFAQDCLLYHKTGRLP